MAVGFSGVANSVTISGSVTSAVPVPSTTQTIVNEGANGTGAAQDFYTVPTGKTFYLYGLAWESGLSGPVYLNDGSTAIFNIGTILTTNYGVFNSAIPIAKYTAGQKVKVNVTLNKFLRIFGVLQDD